MKTTKTTIYIVSLAAMLTTGLFSCSDFLEKEQTKGLTPAQLYGSVNAAEPAVNGLHVSFRKAKEGRDGFTLSLLGLDETKQGIIQMEGSINQAALDNYNGALNGASPQISSMWSKRWSAINTAAEAIRGLEILVAKETNEATLNKVVVLRANACFIRALSMFETTMYWGEIPVVEVIDLLNPERDMSKKSLNIVWKQIHDDLLYASENLDEGKQSSKFRATRGAALAMLGKLYLYAPEASGYRDYNKAIEYFEQVKNIYRLETKYETLFDEYCKMAPYASNESIYELDYICNSSGPNYWQWDMGSRTLANLGESCYIGGYDVALPTEYAYKMKADGGVWEEGDQRKAVSIRTDFTYRGQVFTKPSWGADELDPHIKKWEDRRLDKFTISVSEPTSSGKSMYYSGKNYMYLRLADILLCYAECLNEAGRTAEATDVVNQVRRRAWGGTLPADKEWTVVSKEQFRTDILDERMRELCFEGWRRMDLIRTGKFVELVKERNPWTKKSGTIQDFHMRWPIPNIELSNNPYMDITKDQNPGYN